MILFFLLLAQAAAPTQIERGEALFTDSANGCLSCHALKGKGTAVGPDLKVIARLTPKAIAMAIHSTVTQYVQIVKVKGGDSFPAMTGAQTDTTVEAYDLSKAPPELRKLEKANVTMTPNNGWKHPPSTQKLTNEQMADLVAYIRYAGANNRQPVSPEDVQ